MNLINAQHENDQRPNIIFILKDDQRFDALGYAGNKLIHTPEMDKLAEEGTYFKNALVTTPICAASRASILTGLYERTHGFNFQTGDLRKEYMKKAYPRLLKESGYFTGFYGKYGVRDETVVEQFETYEIYDRRNEYADKRGYYYKTLGKDTVHLTRYTGQKALNFINNVDKKSPFCLSLSFSAPHAHDSAKEQYFWQMETDNQFQGITMPGPDLAGDMYFQTQPEIVKKGFNRVRWKWRFETPKKYQHSVKGYYRMISGIDLEIAKIREELKVKGLDKNTVIIIMGDNGYFLGERQLAGKWLLYDNSIRVPLIIYDPRIQKQMDSEELALNVDVPSTILDLAGLEIPRIWHGRSLMPIVSGKTESLKRDTVLIEHLWEFEHIPPSEGVRTKKWKYFRYVNDKSFEELYDMERDPKEVRNLAKDRKYATVIQKLRQKCDELIVRHSDSYSNPPYDLSTEFLIGSSEFLINDKVPEFGWIVPKGAVSQSAYQILVSISKENLSKNNGDVWDSGQIRSGESTNVSYNGKPLKDGQRYFWKVRIWDEDNRLLKYSKNQSFEIAKVEEIQNSKYNYEEAVTLELLNELLSGGDYGSVSEKLEYLIQNPRKSRELQQHLVTMFHKYYMQTGDSELIEKHYRELKINTSKNAENKGLNINGLSCMSDFAHAIGKLDEELEYRIAILQAMPRTGEQLIDIVKDTSALDIWNIQPKKPGYGVATIKPKMGTLKNSLIEVPTVKGTINCKYEYVSDHLKTFTIDLPANMIAEFEVVASQDDVIKLNGKKISYAFGSIRLHPGVNKIELVVNSF